MVAHESESGWLPPLGLSSPDSQLSAVSGELQEHVARLRGVDRAEKPGRTQYHRDRGNRKRPSGDQVSTGYLAGTGYSWRVMMLWLLGQLSTNTSQPLVGH